MKKLFLLSLAVILLLSTVSCSRAETSDDNTISDLPETTSKETIPEQVETTSYVYTEKLITTSEEVSSPLIPEDKEYDMRKYDYSQRYNIKDYSFEEIYKGIEFYQLPDSSEMRTLKQKGMENVAVSQKFLFGTRCKEAIEVETDYRDDGSAYCPYVLFESPGAGANMAETYPEILRFLVVMFPNIEVDRLETIVYDIKDWLENEHETFKTITIGDKEVLLKAFVVQGHEDEGRAAIEITIYLEER